MVSFFNLTMPALIQVYKNETIQLTSILKLKVYSKFQVPNMFAVQINVPFADLQNLVLKFLHVLY